MDSLFIVIPAYNEEENIENVIRHWYSVLNGKADNSCIVVADSESTDNTHKILKNLQKELTKLKIISDTEKEHGPKVFALYDYAIKNGADYIFQTDSDGQTNPLEFNAFWESRSSYTGIFGYRAKREDGKLREFVEKTVCFLLKLYFGIKVPDANAPFRLMNASVLKKYLYKLKPNYNLPNIMITTYFVFYNEKTAFKSVSFRPRQGGRNSVNVKKIISVGLHALADFAKFKKDLKNNENT